MKRKEIEKEKKKERKTERQTERKKKVYRHSEEILRRKTGGYTCGQKCVKACRAGNTSGHHESRVVVTQGGGGGGGGTGRWRDLNRNKSS